MNYLGNDRNVLRTAELTALNTVPSQAVGRIDADEKVGGGSVALTGNYVGDVDRQFDVEITDGVSSTPRVSQPVLVGVGNGTMTDLSVTGLASQQITVTLRDLGTETRAAYSPFQSATLVARATGAAGNDITLRIDTTGLVATATRFATQGAISTGVNEYAGDDWNFGAATLNPDGTIPATAPRLRFGRDPQVYRAYREFKEGRYVYGFSPAPVRDVPRGTPVFTITGSRTVVISDGTTTDTLPSIVTVYDCLSAIDASSTLVRVDGVVANDRRPGGQGVTELSVWTQPYVVSIAREGTDYVKNAELGITLADTVPTELLTVRCSSARVPSREQWTVRGEVSGALPLALTGEQYAAGGYRFLIPTIANEAGSSTGTVFVQFKRPDANAGGGDPGWRGPFRAEVGAAALNGRHVFTYRQRPAADCTTLPDVVGGPNADCLGITPQEDTQMSAARLLQRQQRLSFFVRTFVQQNTANVPASGRSSVDQDIEYINKAAQPLSQVLVDLGTLETLQPPGRADSTDYDQDEQITVAISGVDYRFIASTPGTSAGSAPSFASAAARGATVTDGSVTWTNHGKAALSLWDEAMTLLETDATPLLGLAAATPNGWDDLTAYALGERLVLTFTDGVMVKFEVTTAGTSGTSDPDWETALENGDTVSDGSVVWTRIGADSEYPPDPIHSLRVTIDAYYYERYISFANEIKAAAGLAANFDNASVNGDGCWRDDSTVTAWFEYDGDEPRSPIIPNLYYHSSRMEADEEGNTVHVSTKEYGFGARFGCPEQLLDGDQLIVSVTGIGGRPTYQEGDEFRVQCTRATPLPFGGGQTGDDTLTFSVHGSVDGAFAPYALNLASPAAYSDGGLGFLITQGPIKYGLGATWTLHIEAAQFRWRVDGGAWSAAADIPSTPVALAHGVSAVFTPGLAPSWVPGDTWSFLAEAVNGVDHLRHPTDARFTWSGSTTITATLPAPAPIRGVLFGDPVIPADAVILLEGSDDDFATMPLSEVIPWRPGTFWHPVDAEHAAYRVSIDKGGSLSWLALGEPLALQIRTGAQELGRLTKRPRLPSPNRRAGQGCSVEHEWLTTASVDALLATLSHACEHDDGRLAIVPNAELPEAAIARFVAESLEVTELRGFQPRDPAQHRQALTLELEAIP